MGRWRKLRTSESADCREKERHEKRISKRGRPIVHVVEKSEEIGVLAVQESGKDGRIRIC